MASPLVSPRRLPLVVAGVLVVLVTSIALAAVFRPKTAYALVNRTTLTVLDGSVLVQKAGTGTAVVAGNGEELGVGDAVQAGVPGHAVITYFDGSTAELGPGSGLRIRELHPPAAGVGLAIRSTLLQGEAWFHVIHVLAEGPVFEVNSPAATAVVRGTVFGMTIQPGGATSVQSSEGVVQLKNARGSVQVQPGFLSVVAAGQPPQPPRPAPPPPVGIRVGLGSPAGIYLCDPLKRCAGYFPGTKTVVNYIPGAWYSGVNGEPQVLILPAPRQGSYALFLPGIGAGNLHLSVGLLTDGGLSQDHDLTIPIAQGEVLESTVTLSPATARAPSLLGFFRVPRAYAASAGQAASSQALSLRLDPRFAHVGVGRIPLTAPQTRAVAEAAKKLGNVARTGATGSGVADPRGALGASVRRRDLEQAMTVGRKTLRSPVTSHATERLFPTRTSHPGASSEAGRRKEGPASPSSSHRSGAAVQAGALGRRRESVPASTRPTREVPSSAATPAAEQLRRRQPTKTGPGVRPSVRPEPRPRRSSTPGHPGGTTRGAVGARGSGGSPRPSGTRARGSPAGAGGARAGLAATGRGRSAGPRESPRPQPGARSGGAAERRKNHP
ncbi:MAG: FecR family protein [Chloroflexota bacterium]